MDTTPPPLLLSSPSVATAFRSIPLPPHHPRGLRRRTPTRILPRKPFSPAASVPSLGITRGSNQRLVAVYSSNFDRSNGNVVKEKAGSSSSSGSSGPPVATILAGVVVFVLFLWIVGSIVWCIIGLIVNAPPSPK